MVNVLASKQLRSVRWGYKALSAGVKFGNVYMRSVPWDGVLFCEAMLEEMISLAFIVEQYNIVLMAIFMRFAHKWALCTFFPTNFPVIYINQSNIESRHYLVNRKAIWVLVMTESAITFSFTSVPVNLVHCIV